MRVLSKISAVVSFGLLVLLISSCQTLPSSPTAIPAPPTLTLLLTPTETLILLKIVTVEPKVLEINPPAMAELGEPDIRLIDSNAMSFIPPGKFVMGVPILNSTIANSDEKPMHEVYLDGFWIDQTEVTNEKFAAFLNSMGNQIQGGVTWLDAKSNHVRIHLQGETWVTDPGYEQHPAVEISWFGANSFCAWNHKRLPTEAEWEKSAHGAFERTFPWGESISCDLANFLDCSADTAPVGSFPDGASLYGIYDLAGNAWEWVNDWYAEDYYQGTPLNNPAGPAEGFYRVIRGGSYFSVGTQIRTTYRDKLKPTETGYSNGFRCARTAIIKPNAILTPIFPGPSPTSTVTP